MEVVNVRVAKIRPKYKDLREWMRDEKNEYIGRKGVVFIEGERYPKEESKWANPYKLKEGYTREEAIKEYERYIREKIEREGLEEELMKLEGKKLGCWCKPEACHGDVLVKIIKEMKAKR